MNKSEKEELKKLREEVEELKRSRPIIVIQPTHVEPVPAPINPWPWSPSTVPWTPYYGPTCGSSGNFM